MMDYYQAITVSFVTNSQEPRYMMMLQSQVNITRIYYYDKNGQNTYILKRSEGNTATY